jgi:mRNA-degrading endonuclease YafQ of YafQ-DinJ toxin-antitoxin module
VKKLKKKTSLRKDFIFKKVYKTAQKTQELFFARITFFEEDPNNPLLRNHALQGKLKGYYILISPAISGLYTKLLMMRYIYTR